MFAIIQTGGKQYRVAVGQELAFESLAVEEGQSVDFNEVLLISDGDSDVVGKPYITGAKVSAEVLGHGRGKKVEILKFKRRKHHMKRQGHRQNFTKVKITSIETGEK